MRRLITVIVGLSMSVVSIPASAGTLDETLGTGHRVDAEKLILKDPMFAGLMSASLPGLGQVYTGERKKGLLFFIGTIGALGATYGFAHPAVLDLVDYDRVEYGGNADGLMSVVELENWEDDKFQDDAFSDLSTSRKVGAITSASVGLSLYIWNIIDARRSSRAHNEQVVQRRIDLGMTASETQTGLALNYRF